MFHSIITHIKFLYTNYWKYDYHPVSNVINDRNQITIQQCIDYDHRFRFDYNRITIMITN